MRILLRGGGNFLGINIAQHLLSLDKGHQVIILDEDLKETQEIFEEEKRVILWEDERENKKVVENFLKNVDAVINFPSGKEEKEITSGKVLYESPYIQGKKILQFSSYRVYGIPRRLPVHEEEVPRPISQEGLAELIGEDIARFYAQKVPLPLLILRTSEIYGPYIPENTLMGKILWKIFREEPVEVWKNGEWMMDLLFVQDFVKGVEKALEKVDQHHGEVIHLSTGRGVPLKRVINSLMEISEREERILRFTEALPSWGVEFILSSAKSKILLNWSPQFDLDTGLKITYNWMNQVYQG